MSNLTTLVSHEERAAAFRSTLEDVVNFASTPIFVAVMDEMWQLPEELRHEFVDLVLLSPEELARRGVQVPEDMDIQRSWFEDDRPTLFCVTKRLPPGMGWKVATVTIDNPIREGAHVSWRPPATLGSSEE